MNANSSASTNSSNWPDSDASLLTYLSPAEMVEMDELLGLAPTEETKRRYCQRLLDLLPLWVCRSMLAALRQAKGDNSPHAQATLAELNLPGDLKLQTSETWVTGQWPGEPDPPKPWETEELSRRAAD